jgi:hypothetical protein
LKSFFLLITALFIDLSIADGVQSGFFELFFFLGLKEVLVFPGPGPGPGPPEPPEPPEPPDPGCPPELPPEPIGHIKTIILYINNMLEILFINLSILGYLCLKLGFRYLIYIA